MCVRFRISSCLGTSKKLSLGCDECPKHSGYARVCLMFLALFYIEIRIFIAHYLIIIVGVYAGAIGEKRAAFGSNFGAEGCKA